MMEETVIEVMYTYLSEIVSNSIAVLIPLIGAFWIYKVTAKNAAEGKIFELGRDIANILRVNNVRSPIEPIAYSYIDDAKYNIEEKNHEKSLDKLLRENLFYDDSKSTEEEKKKSAILVIAIATEKIKSLVPSNVNWTGKGWVHSLYGVDIETTDSFFPFGTKRYKEWTENFGRVYNLIWAISHSRSFFIDDFLKNNIFNLEKNDVEEWLDKVDSCLNEIHPIHSKILTQMQIIDTQIDLPRLNKNLFIILFYVFLLLLSGFVSPKLMIYYEVSSINNFIALVFSTAISYIVIVLRIISAVYPRKEKYILREIYFPKLQKELEGMSKICMRYKNFEINNIISLNSELKINSNIKNNLSILSEKIDFFNENARILSPHLIKLIEQVEKEFFTKKVNQSSIILNVFELVVEVHNLEKIKSRLLKENINFTLSYNEINSSRNICTINLSELDSTMRMKLCNKLDYIRDHIQSLSIYKSTKLALDELQEARERALISLIKSYSKEL